MKTILSSNVSEFITQKSKFINYSFNVKTTEQANEIVKELWKEHRKATHICYAYRLIDYTEIFEDDGEPSLTAGKPMLSVLKGEDIVDSIFLSVRYFGGIKLGKGGLIRAYTKSVKMAIENTKFTKLYFKALYRVVIDYRNYSILENYINNFKIITKDSNFSDNVELFLYMDKTEKEKFSKFSDNKLNNLMEVKFIKEVYYSHALGEYYE